MQSVASYISGVNRGTAPFSSWLNLVNLVRLQARVKAAWELVRLDLAPVVLTIGTWPLSQGGQVHRQQLP
jgi:hypothetical protein